MKGLKKLLLPLIIGMFLMVGCGQVAENNGNNQGKENNKNITSKDNSKNNKKEENKEVEKEESIYPLTVKDSLGTEMTIESKPEKIISLTLGTDEMLLSLVDHEKILALSGKIAENKGASNVSDIAVNFDKAESNIEKVISLQPELVFASSWIKKEKIDQMREAGIIVYCYGTANNIEQQKEIILEVANIVGEKENGEKLVKEMDDKLNFIKEKLAGLKEEDKLRVLSYTSYGSTNAKGTTFDDVAKKAGCINVASEADLEGWPQISKEKIIELNPDIITLPSVSYDDKTPEDFKKSIMEDESFKDVKAVKEGRVYLLPDKHMSAVSQYIVFGVEDLAKAAYPDLFK
ncbi:ABC transporter substrate-binding protein [Oceanirhabdus seepicola]|uniref:ABC transporter substrate-binding protein n=1 Tax=Oceanirhabdus seepicola TaxID=2828781 RepID=A0A9J6P8E3_9CLOT|nr:ABC transporter substrate-binding protein [Oceanirhabdus seepicola]MCM1992294.1 ABC transporter substrate-binding protein [Oceanirhabdus seepicola]